MECMPQVLGSKPIDETQPSQSRHTAKPKGAGRLGSGSAEGTRGRSSRGRGSHNAFRYFGEAYGVTFLSAQGVSTETETEASAAAVVGLISKIRDEQARAILAENIPTHGWSSASPRRPECLFLACSIPMRCPRRRATRPAVSQYCATTRSISPRTAD